MTTITAYGFRSPTGQALVKTLEGVHDSGHLIGDDDGVAENEEKEEVKGGYSLCNGSSELNLVSPTRLRPLVGVDIRYVAAGCAAVHCCTLCCTGC
ncbi:hypothetical protein HanHA89_Chr12g0463821 [Helianthus annuus]|nr:hypothetical protein HanHA89_Chr12g0463821 [Helianthus annuus]